jgi:D-glycerate 3-kinase
VTTTDTPDTSWERAWLAAEGLPEDYAALAARYFAPLARRIAAQYGERGAPLLVGVNGSQGSGKSTCCAWLVQALREEHGLSAIALSLDDFYLTHAERQLLGRTVHPLLATRGVPGTHDIELLRATLGALMGQESTRVVRVPRFDKARDDRAPAEAWDRVAAPVAAVLLEGWCLGARPEAPAALAAPVNALEADEDPDGRWRRYVNNALRDGFPPLHAAVDYWVMLRAPSFACVYRWRLEQERKLRAKAGAGTAVMDDAGVARFVQYFERLTRHCLAELPGHMDVIFTLDNDRQIVAAEGL